MNLAAGLLFIIWCSIVFVAIGGWAFMTIMKQDKTIYQRCNSGLGWWSRWIRWCGRAR